MKHEGSNQMRQAPSKGAPSLHSSIRPRRKAETAAALLTELNPHAMRSPGSIPVRKSAKAPENGNHGRASGFGQPGLGVQDAISCLGCKAGFCRQVLNGERQEGSVTNVKECKEGARAPGFIPSSGTTQGQAKSHALLPSIYLEHKLGSHHSFPLATRTELQILSYCMERWQRLPSKSSTFSVFKTQTLFPGNKDSGKSREQEALSIAS